MQTDIDAHNSIKVLRECSCSLHGSEVRQDELGSPLRYVDGAGDIIDSYGYDEFGGDLYGNQGTSQPFGFTGYTMDIVAGMYFAQGREYAPVIGHFVAEDRHWNHKNMLYGSYKRRIPNRLAIQQSKNLYDYCIGNPLKFSDLTGNSISIPDGTGACLDPDTCGEMHWHSDEILICPECRAAEILAQYNDLWAGIIVETCQSLSMSEVYEANRINNQIQNDAQRLRQQNSWMRFPDPPRMQDNWPERQSSGLSDLFQQALDMGDQYSGPLGFGQIVWGIYKVVKGGGYAFASVKVTATGIGAPFGLMGATYASFHIATGANSIWKGINNVFDSVRGWFNQSDEHNDFAYDCPLSE